MNGGYKIVDFKNENLISGKTVTITGVYDSIKNNYRKPILISGLVIDSIEKPDMYVYPKVVDSSYEIETIYGTITITAMDMVKFVAKA